MSKNTYEIFHQPNTGEGYHWYMVEVNENNYDFWAKRDGVESCGGLGSNYFKQPLSFKKNWKKRQEHEDEKLKSYAIYASDIAQDNPAMPSFDHIEMMCGVYSHEDSPISTHMGIFRVASYTGTHHQSLSMKLHSFGAKCLIDKAYMTTSPVAKMRYIMYRALTQNPDMFVWVGQDDKTYKDYKSHNSSEERQSAIANIRAQLETYWTKGGGGSNYEWSIIWEVRVKNLLLKHQDELLSKNKTFCPFEINADNNTMSIKDENGDILLHTKMVEQSPIGWLFSTVVLSEENWTTFKIDQLAKLDKNEEPIEHSFIPVENNVEHYSEISEDHQRSGGAPISTPDSLPLIGSSDDAGSDWCVIS